MASYGGKVDKNNQPIALSLRVQNKGENVKKLSLHWHSLIKKAIDGNIFYCHRSMKRNSF